MKVYLAGKMDAEHGSWRDAILGKAYDAFLNRDVPRWEMLIAGNFEEHEAPSAIRWPQRPNTLVLGLHDYVGPYRLTWMKKWDSKYGGYFHGTPCVGQHGMADQKQHRAPVVANCIEAIHRADMVFAYLNRPDCFGTLAELGMARALGKFTYIAVDERAQWEWDDYWFIGEIASAVGDGWSIWHGDYPTNEKDRVGGYIRDALVQWTARPAPPSPVALAERGGGALLEQDAAASFSQIARWSSDPRVRQEAQRMLRRLTS